MGFYDIGVGQSLSDLLFRFKLILVGLSLILIQIPLTLAAESQQRLVQPNIIILLVDDLGYGDLSSYGHPSIKTPALDRLAAEGQRWTDFYATAPVCSPTRGALMTGKLPVRSGLYGLKSGVFSPDSTGGIPSKHRTIAQALKDLGYETAMFGKWHLGDSSHALPTRHGFDTWLGTPYSNDVRWQGHPDYQALQAKRKRGELSLKETQQLSELGAKRDEAAFSSMSTSSDWDVPLVESKKRLSGYTDKIIERPVNQETLTKRYTEDAVAYIKDHANGVNPFFLFVSHNMPHVPVFASKNFKGKSVGGFYGDAVEEIDWSVEQIRHSLEEAGIAENTLLIFSSDNGAAGYLATALAGPLKGFKGLTFEGGVRVPGIFWWPGHIKPEVVHGIGSLTDLYATALSLAGSSPLPNDFDSIDLSPVFKGKPSPREHFFYYSRGRLLGYRKGAWKVSFTENGYSASKKYQLYNLYHDPSESTDLSEKYPEVLASLIAEAKQEDAAITRAAPIFDQ